MKTTTVIVRDIDPKGQIYATEVGGQSVVRNFVFSPEIISNYRGESLRQLGVGVGKRVELCINSDNIVELANLFPERT